jgi:hypothetical protein
MTRNRSTKIPCLQNPPERLDFPTGNLSGVSISSPLVLLDLSSNPSGATLTLGLVVNMALLRCMGKRRGPSVFRPIREFPNPHDGQMLTP